VLLGGSRRAQRRVPARRAQRRSPGQAEGANSEWNENPAADAQ